jgi:hypothetical protein
MEKVMINFIIGLVIGGFFGVIFISMLTLRWKEPECFAKKNISEESLGSELPLKEKYRNIRQQVI